jgi:CheY-like chemotaxis protein
MKKIILAGEDQTIHNVIHLILDDDYDVISITDSQKLLHNEFEIPDLFMIDRHLPGFDALDVCRHLKQNNFTKHIPVIMIMSAPNITNLAKAAGANVVIEKPFQIRELRRIVEEQLK